MSCSLFQQPFRSRSRSAYAHLVVCTEPFALDFGRGVYMIGAYVQGFAKIAENLSV